MIISGHAFCTSSKYRTKFVRFYKAGIETVFSHNLYAKNFTEVHVAFRHFRIQLSTLFRPPFPFDYRNIYFLVKNRLESSPIQELTSLSRNCGFAGAAALKKIRILDLVRGGSLLLLPGSRVLQSPDDFFYLGKHVWCHFHE